MILDFLIRLGYLFSWGVYPFILVIQSDLLVPSKQSPGGYTTYFLKQNFGLYLT